MTPEMVLATIRAVAEAVSKGFEFACTPEGTGAIEGGQGESKGGEGRAGESGGVVGEVVYGEIDPVMGTLHFRENRYIIGGLLG